MSEVVNSPSSASVVSGHSRWIYESWCSLYPHSLETCFRGEVKDAEPLRLYYDARAGESIANGQRLTAAQGFLFSRMNC